MRIHVTGERGFIGSRLAESLLDSGQQPVFAGRLTADSTELIELSADDVLVHLAATTPQGRMDVESALAADVRLTAKLAQLCAAADASLVFTSTAGVYRTQSEPLNENSQTVPASLYGEAKLAAENSILQLVRSQNLRCRILRLFNVYGEGQRPDYFLPYLVYEFLRGNIPEVRSPDSIRDFIHVDDVVNAIVSLCESDDWSLGELVLNIGTGVGVAGRDVVATIAELTNRMPEADFGNGAADCFVADVGRAAAAGLTADVCFESGISRLVDSIAVQMNTDVRD